MSTELVRVTAMRAVLRALVWIVLGAVLLLVSALAHVDSPPGRRVAGQAITSSIEAEIAGAMVIDEVTHVGIDGTLRARGVRFETSQGARVVWADRVEADLDVAAAWSGAIRLTELDVTGGGVRVHVPEEGRPSLVRAFDAPDGGGASEEPVDIDLRSRFEAMSLVIDADGAPTFRLRKLEGGLRIGRDDGGSMRVRLDGVRGRWTEPTPIVGAVPLHSLSGDVTAGADRVVDMRFALELGDDTLKCRLEHFAEPEPRVRLRVDSDGAQSVLASLGLMGLGAALSPLEVERGEVRLSAPGGR